MGNFKIPEVASLGRILTKEELKTIIGGKTITISCTCKLRMKGETAGGQMKNWIQGAEPTGAFYTPELCAAACDATCKTTVSCEGAEYTFSTSGSGS